MDVCNKSEQNTPGSPWFLRGMHMYNREWGEGGVGSALEDNMVGN